jgi:hypothetical protein
VGRNVYFQVPKGTFEGVREFYTTDNVGANDASDVTSHVPKYIPKGVYKLAPALNEDFLAVLTTGDRSTIYAYKYYWNNNEKLQSAWSKWTFPATDTILNVEFIESEMYLVVNRPSGLYLESLSIAAGDIGLNEPYAVHLDRKRLVPKAGLSFVSPYTTISGLGWNPDDGEYVAVVPSGQGHKAGVIAPVIWDGATAKVVGDFTDSDLVVGRKYMFRYGFSQLMVRSQSGQGQKADTVGRLQVRKMQVNFADTGHFQARVTPVGREPYTYTYSGKALGVPSAALGRISMETGAFSFPVLSQNTTVAVELVSDSPLPAAFLSVDWEGYYVRRSQAL